MASAIETWITVVSVVEARLESAARKPEIESILKELTKQAGFSHYALAWANISPVRPWFAGMPSHIASISPEWLERYWRRRRYVHDCIVERCVTGTRPLLWSEASRSGVLSPRQRRIAAEAAAHGLVTGITVPVHGPGTRFTLLSFGRSRQSWPTEFPAEIAYCITELLAQRFHAAVWRLDDQSRPAPPFGPAIGLKPREMQCLAWAARGKSSSEIGNILGISARTVYFHIGNAMAALGVTTRGQAIARAMALGLIER